MLLDFIQNGKAYGSVAERLVSADMDPGVLRPFDYKGKTYCTLTVWNDKKECAEERTIMVRNAPALLTREAWMRIDEEIQQVARPRLKIWADLYGRQPYTVPDGMATTMLLHQTMTDAGAATISMDGLRRSERDRTTFDYGLLPLPIIHEDFSFSLREILTSKRSRAPLDTSMAQQAGMRVAETVEKLALGVSGSFSYGGGTIYGFTNFPQRITKTMTTPTTANQVTTQSEVVQMIASAKAKNYRGPYTLYVSPNWFQWLAGDYNATRGNTLNERLLEIPGIDAIEQLDYLTGYTMLLVQYDARVAQGVQGMDFTTVQWESQGGMQVNFKVMCIKVPRLRADANGQTGIVHGTAP